MDQYLEELTGWGNYPRVPSYQLAPSTQAGLATMVHNHPEGVIARGMGRSYGDQAVNQQRVVIAMQSMNRLIDFDPKTGMLECEAGTTLDDIIKIFGPGGYFPFITPGTRYVTVGGCIANDVHGKAHHVDGSFISSVQEITIMLANGKVLTASRKLNRELFYGCFGGLGLLGMILSAKIRLRKIETTYFKQKAIQARNLEEMLDAIDGADHDYDYSVAWVNPLTTGKRMGEGVLTVGNAAALDDLPRALRQDPLKIAPDPALTLPFFAPNFSLNGATVRILNRAIHFIQKSAPEFTHYQKFFYPLDSINLWNRGYGKRGFIQYQFVVPLEGGRKSIHQIFAAITRSGCMPFLNVLKKFGDKETGPIGYPMEGYNFAIDFPVTRGLLPFTARLDQMVLDAGGRIYSGKDAVTDAASFHAMYGSARLKQWFTLKKKYDPKNRFSSNISRRLKLDL